MAFRTTLLAATGALIIFAGGAHAEIAPVQQTRVPLAVPGSTTTFSAREAEAELVRAAVLPRRSVDRQLNARISGSAGFLCGLQEGQTDSGSAALAGHDPHGRFIGAKLSFAFR